MLDIHTYTLSVTLTTYQNETAIDPQPPILYTSSQTYFNYIYLFIIHIIYISFTLFTFTCIYPLII